MGEEQKKPEDTKEEAPKAEEKKEEAKAEEKKDNGEEKKEEAPPPPPPPEEIVMRVFMHCEGCARKVRRCLKGFSGVEDVMTDSKSHKVVVKGKKAAEEPMRVVERVAKKTGRKVELLSPLPKPPEEKKEEEKKAEEEKPKVEEKKEEPVVITVVLKVHMHCEACGQRIKKRILKMKGVQAAETNVKASEVTVKGIFEPPKLVEHLKKAGKQAIVVSQDPPEKKDEDEKKDGSADAAKDDKKAEGDKAEGEKKDAKDEGKEKKDEGATDDAAAATAKMVELMTNEMQYNPYRLPVAYHQYYPYNQYAPQIFSDENPNACFIM